MPTDDLYLTLSKPIGRARMHSALLILILLEFNIGVKTENSDQGTISGTSSMYCCNKVLHKIASIHAKVC
jgi:hypothetical protein